jgi:uncharacterized RDD family membrane protein YckC
MNTIKITTSQNIELEYDLASLGERIAGRIFDSLIIGAYVLFLFYVFALVFARSKFDSLTALQVLTIVLCLLPIIFYDLLSELIMNGQSVGKRIMKIKVISLDGGRASFGQYIIRWLFRLVDFTLTNSVCALVCVAASPNKQRVGDMVAGTTLIRTSPRTGLQQTIYIPTTDINYKVSFPEITSFNDKDMQLIKEVINQVARSGNIILAFNAAEKIKQTLKIQTMLEPYPFLQVLLMDYNHLTSQA